MSVISHECEGKLQNCCINIYVNSNIQGVNNSTLNGSEVKMGSPGVCFFFGDMEPKSHQNNRSEVHQNPKPWQWGLVMLLIFLVLIFLLVLEIRMFHSQTVLQVWFGFNFQANSNSIGMQFHGFICDFSNVLLIGVMKFFYILHGWASGLGDSSWAQSSDFRENEFNLWWSLLT